MEGAITPERRPVFWVGLWERYVESQTDYRAGSEALARKLAESGVDAWQLLEWLGEPTRSELATGPQAQLLAPVFAGQFERQTREAVPAGGEEITRARRPLAVGAAGQLLGQRQRRKEEGACGLQGTGGRDGMRSGVGTGGADAQFHRGHRHPSGIRA